MQLHINVLACLITAGLCAGCSDTNEQAKLQEKMVDQSEAMEKSLRSDSDKAEALINGLTRAVNQLNEKVETVSARELKAMLPVDIPGMTRTEYSASKKGIEGFSVSHADALFRQDDGHGYLELSITDIGNIRGFAAIGLEMLDLEIDEENQDGFKRTGEYKGFKSLQQHERKGSGSESEMLVFVGDRFVVRFGGRNVKWDLLEDVADSVPVEDLAKLVN